MADDQQEALCSLVDRDQTLWTIYEEYSLENGMLLSDGDIKDTYHPGDHPEIAGQFAQLADGSPHEMLDFVRRWGSLGYDMVRYDRSEWPRSRPSADPVLWVRLKAFWVKTCLGLLHDLREKDSRSLAKQLDLLARVADQPKSYDPDVPLALLPGPQADVTSRQIRKVIAGESNEERARRLVAWLLSQETGGLRPTLRVGSNSKPLEFEYGFRALIQVIYLHVAQIGVRQQRQGRCEECGSYFLRTDERMRFCPPAPELDLHGARKQSTCAMRHRTRNWRAAKNAEKGVEKGG